MSGAGRKACSGRGRIGASAARSLHARRVRDRRRGRRDPADASTRRRLGVLHPPTRDRACLRILLRAKVATTNHLTTLVYHRRQTSQLRLMRLWCAGFIESSTLPPLTHGGAPLVFRLSRRGRARLGYRSLTRPEAGTQLRHDLHVLDAGRDRALTALGGRAWATTIDGLRRDGLGAQCRSLGADTPTSVLAMCSSSHDRRTAQPVGSEAWLRVMGSGAGEDLPSCLLQRAIPSQWGGRWPHHFPAPRMEGAAHPVIPPAESCQARVQVARLRCGCREADSPRPTAMLERRLREYQAEELRLPVPQEDGRVTPCG